MPALGVKYPHLTIRLSDVALESFFREKFYANIRHLVELGLKFVSHHLNTR